MPHTDGPSSRRNLPRWALILAIWTVLGLFDATHSYFHYAAQGKAISWPRALALGLSLWYAWAIVAVFVFQFARRFPFEQKNWPRRLLLHLVTGCFFALVKLAIDYPIIKWFYCPTPYLLTFPRFYVMALTSHFHPYVLIYWAMLGVSHALNYYHRYQDRERRAVTLEARLAQNQLQLLKMQLHPHFLFNTLNAISALIHLDVEAADRMLARLGDLLRLVLENDGIQEVRLQQELDFLKAYVEIEEIRFGPRLNVCLHAEPDVRDACVPSLILQPLVENAIRHGLSSHDRAGRIQVRASRLGEVLRLEVEDDGPGLTVKPNCLREGVGLSNTRARLQQLYGVAHRFELDGQPGNGLVVTIDIPFREDREVAGRRNRPRRSSAGVNRLREERTR
jgi:two-component sensor histidine kinase